MLAKQSMLTQKWAIERKNEPTDFLFMLINSAFRANLIIIHIKKK